MDAVKEYIALKCMLLIGMASGRKPIDSQDFGLVEEGNGVVRGTRLQRLRFQLREFFAEILGTFTLVTFGSGAIAQTSLYNETDPLAAKFIVSLGISMGLAMAVYISGQISGGHVNPAITTSLAVFRGFPWRKVPVYYLAQLIGALLSAGAITLFNYPAISQLEPLARAAMFASGPPSGVTYSITFANICSGAALLLIGVMSLTDPRNKCPPWLFPFGLVIIQFLICLILPGYPLNPAWDFGYRLFALPLSPTHEFDFVYSLVPLIAPLVGGTLGVAIYDFLLPNFPENESVPS